MIAKISERLCPVITVNKKSWTTTKALISSDGHYLKKSGLFIYCNELIQLTECLGVLSYAIKTKDEFVIFDLSFSHLCPKQIQIATKWLYENFS